VISIFCGDKRLVIRLNKGYDRPQRILAVKTLFIQRIYIYCKIIQAGFDAAGQPVQIGTYLHKSGDVISRPGAVARYSGIGKRPAVNR